MHIRIKDGKKEQADLARVEILMGGATIWIVVKEETRGWPFEIENASDHAVIVAQRVRTNFEVTF